MVVRSGRSTESDLVDSVDALERVGASVMGTLLVGTPNTGRRQAYYYDYYSAEGLDGPGRPAKPFATKQPPGGVVPEPSVDSAATTLPASAHDEVGSSS